MRIGVDGVAVRFAGEDNALRRTLAAALAEQGAVPAADDRVPGLLVASLPLLPGGGFDWADLRGRVRETGRAMKTSAGGRIVMLMSAAAALPMRRHPDYSADMAGALAFLRALAMELAPEVAVNGLGLGAVGEPLIGGDAAMVGHASVGRAGRLDEACAAALFLCDPSMSYLTGQMLAVDGGWSVGYGRNF